MFRSQGTAAVAAPVLAAAIWMLGGCVERGDFGRVKRSAWNDGVAVTGALSAAARGEAISFGPLTDDEAEMRERAWRFLVPAHDRPYLDRLLAELVATRIVPPDAIEPDRRAYFDGLLSTVERSPVPAYRRLSSDAAADAVLVAPFAAAAARVLRADRIRLRTVAMAGEVAPAEASRAGARVAENRCLIAWVRAASTFRLGNYRYALEHLVIEAPEADAVPTERALARLASERTRLDALPVPALAAAACLGDPGPPPEAGPLPGEPLVRKG